MAATNQYIPRRGNEGQHTYVSHHRLQVLRVLFALFINSVLPCCNWHYPSPSTSAFPHPFIVMSGFSSSASQPYLVPRMPQESPSEQDVALNLPILPPLRTSLNGCIQNKAPPKKRHLLTFHHFSPSSQRHSPPQDSMTLKLPLESLPQRPRQAMPGECPPVTPTAPAKSRNSEKKKSVGNARKANYKLKATKSQIKPCLSKRTRGSVQARIHWHKDSREGDASLPLHLGNTKYDTHSDYDVDLEKVTYYPASESTFDPDGIEESRTSRISKKRFHQQTFLHDRFDSGDEDADPDYDPESEECTSSKQHYNSPRYGNQSKRR